MTIRVERTFEVPVGPEQLWEFISKPENRARAISVIERYELHGDDRATWHVRLPLPLIDRTVRVETRDLARDPPQSVEFVGDSAAMEVRGEHLIEETGDGSRLTNTFVVDGRLPGVESFFKRNLDHELDNLERALEEELGSGA